MKIITLYGPNKSGKTTLIKSIYNELGKEFQNRVFFEKCGADNNDFKALVRYRKKTIAFCSIGDPADDEKLGYKHIPAEYILAGLVFASEHKADILINAFSKSFSTMKNGKLEFTVELYKALVETNRNNLDMITMISKPDDYDFQTKQQKEKLEEVLEKINLYIQKENG